RLPSPDGEYASRAWTQNRGFVRGYCQPCRPVQRGRHRPGQRVLAALPEAAGGPCHARSAWTQAVASGRHGAQQHALGSAVQPCFGRLWAVRTSWLTVKSETFVRKV